MTESNTTVLHDRHVALGARMTEFAGWDMPLQYPTGIVAEHLQTRRTAGLFDVSHMGRFAFVGDGALALLQHALTNNAAALDVGQAQYTIIQNAGGGAVDDAYLYRFVSEEYLLVVNAANRRKDWDHFQSLLPRFDRVRIVDRSDELAMISLQGPSSKGILAGVVDSGPLPEPKRNALGCLTIGGVSVFVARTGYTGEPIGLELFVPAEAAPGIWDLLVGRGAVPAGLGARDTLRLEAGLPLFGHELGTDVEGRQIPIFACPLARFAVSFSPLKGDFIGAGELKKQHEAFRRLTFGDSSAAADLPRIVMPIAVLGRGVARPPAEVLAGDGDERVGYVTSGTTVPYWQGQGQGLGSTFTDRQGMRAIGLALLNSELREGAGLQVRIRSRNVPAVVTPYHLRSEAPPYAHAVPYEDIAAGAVSATAAPDGKVQWLVEQTITNTLWRQRECINLIPSEQTPSPMVRLLSVMDPAFRYAEHKVFKAFEDAEVFYYQGTDFIGQVEVLLADELRQFLSCTEVETRPISGQMANAIVFSGLVDFLNRANRKEEPRRIRRVMNNDIMKGGHLSSQPMGALRDFVARDGTTERPAVVNFPVCADNPYKRDVAACADLLQQHRPELIILGKSVVLGPEPVAPIRRMVDELGLQTVIMYDMAHVLGLVGPHFQEPFAEGADIVTGSTHKTFFGTQRGVVAADIPQQDRRYELWEAIERRTFPGSVSNHHLGTLLGLLLAACEMNHFKDQYQPAVLANAKAFARALKDCGLDVAGDPEVSFTQTHQVVVNVGYARGPELARRLEDNNIIVNYQAAPDEEGFSASGSLRLGVAEMTRFGMTPPDFQTIAQLIHDVLVKGQSVIDQVKALRSRFTDLHFCFSGKQYDQLLTKLHGLI